VGGMDVCTIDDVSFAKKDLKRQSLLPEDVEVVVQRAPYGKRNRVPPDERGWVYLERFCSMVKVAMVDESEIDRVVFSNSQEVITQIQKGGAKLREAAKEGEESIGRVLETFLSEMEEKHFGGNSMDKICTTGGLGGDLEADDVLSDREVVTSIMRKLVADLPSHWAARVEQQRQRQLVLAVNRGDLAATRSLLLENADPNVQDSRGSTCLHTAVSRGDFDVLQVLLQFGACKWLQDGAGQTPAHLVPLWVADSTLEWFDLLIDHDVLTLTTDAGLSVFERFWAWSEAANKGKPFQPIQRRLRVLDPYLPLLLAERIELRRFSRSTASKTCSDTSESIEYSTFETKTGAPVHMWRPAEGRAKMCMVIVSMPLSLPVPMQMSCWHELADRVVLEFNCIVFLVTSGLRPLPEAGQPLKDFIDDLVILIDGLPWKGHFVLVENSSGAATSLIWLLRKRISGVLVLNAGGFFSEEFVGSTAHQKLTKVLSQREEELRPAGRDVAQLIDDFDISLVCSGPAELLAPIREDWEASAWVAPEQFWRMSAAHYQWCSREQTEALEGRPLLGMVATLACSKHGPAVMSLESMRKVHGLLPKARFVHIEDSKIWWEIENPDFVISECVALLHVLSPGDILEV